MAEKVDSIGEQFFDKNSQPSREWMQNLNSCFAEQVKGCIRDSILVCMFLSPAFEIWLNVIWSHCATAHDHSGARHCTP